MTDPVVSSYPGYATHDPAGDLVAWLTQVWDEDEKRATGCIADVGSHRVGDPFPDGSGDADYDAFPSYPWGLPQWELSFMAGPGHPDSVLARIAADRQILAECCIVLEDKAPGHTRERMLAWTVLRLLAGAHRGRPGWQEAWQ